MSLQTKKQAIGYIAQALFNSGAGREIIRDFIIYGNKEIKLNLDLDNWATMAFFEGYAEREGMSEEVIKNGKSALYWAFDELTVEDADAKYLAFCEICSLYRYMQEDPK